MNDSDDWLLLRRPDGQGLHALFERHKDYVFRLASGFTGYHHLAEDVTQEVFLRVAKGRSRWRPRAQFRTWLYQITLNTARELKRKHGQTGEPDDCVRENRCRSPQHQVALADDLNRALATLPDRQREVVVLRFYEGLSTAETAAVMHCRPGTVKAHLHRAVAALRQTLTDYPDSPIPTNTD